MTAATQERYVRQTKIVDAIQREVEALGHTFETSPRHTVDGVYVTVNIHNAYDNSTAFAEVVVLGGWGSRGRNRSRFVAKGTQDGLNYRGIAKRMIAAAAEKKEGDRLSEIAAAGRRKDTALEEKLSGAYPNTMLKVDVYDGGVDLKFSRNLTVAEAEAFLKLAMELETKAVQS